MAYSSYLSFVRGRFDALWLTLLLGIGLISSLCLPALSWCPLPSTRPAYFSEPEGIRLSFVCIVVLSVFLAWDSALSASAFTRFFDRSSGILI